MIIKKTQKALLPLYLTSFFQGLIFWYAIEKVFMTSIGFNPMMITISVVTMTIVSIATEIPAGVLADRWSRKKTLVLSMAFLVGSASILGLSNTVFNYMIGVVLFALYNAAYSGLTDSILYDTTMELEDSSKNFNRYFGRSKLYTSIAWVAGSLLGALIGQKYGLQWAYLCSIPSCVFALVAALFVYEPKRHESLDEQTKLVKHVRQTFQHVIRKGHHGWVVICILATSIPMMFLMEVDQLWPLALALPVLWYGPLNAVLLSGPGLGGILADKITSRKHIMIVSLLGLICVSLLSIHHIVPVVVGQFGTITTYMALSIIATGILHDNTPSRIRTGVSSAISTLSSLVIMPLLLSFGYLVKKYSIFTANYMLILVALIVVLSFTKIAINSRSK